MLCAVLATACNFVPIPFVDDLLRKRVLHFMVRQTQHDHGRTYSSTCLSPLYSESRGCVAGCLFLLVKVPLKLLLFPIRKILAWLGAAHSLSKDLTTMILLGRSLDRCMACGRLANDTTPTELREEARQIKLAFDEAARGFDVGVLSDLVGAAVGKAAGLWSAAARSLRRVFARKKLGDIDSPVDEAERAVIDESAERLERALSEPEAVEALEAFDRAFDERLAMASFS